ncbi:MAG: serine hydrolase [Bacteroidaceae bacterium]|nr:serine hydrolase [Bacteroidaceae bacterium]
MKILLIVLLSFLPMLAFAQHLEKVAPEQVGMDNRHLQYADAAINQAIAEKNIPGAVLAVVRHGKMAYLKAYGNKQIYPTQVPMTTETIFDMASCSKAMSTAVCAMILAERGQIRMLDAVNTYFPEFQNWKPKDGGEEVTIRIEHLMTHTSGLPPYAPTQELMKQYGSPNPKGLLQHICNVQRDFEPATDFQYSCLNFITLQHIIEKVSGQSLRDFARENIFDVLGMDYTDYLPCAPDKRGNWKNTSEAHWASLMPVGQDWRTIVAPTTKEGKDSVLIGQVHDPLAHFMNGGVSGNAGVFSCAEDIAVLCAALQNGGEWNGRRIMSPLTVKAMRSVPRREATIGRTLGWDCFTDYASNNGDIFSPNTYGHTGFTGTSIVIDPDNDTSVILLINAVHPEEGHSVVRLRSLVSNAVAGSIIQDGAMWQGETYNAHWWERYLQFQQQPVRSDDTVLLGNSLTENGGDWAGLKWPVRNMGVIGDDIAGINSRLNQVLEGHPDRLFLMAGINDVSHQLSTDEIVSQLAALVDRILRESPQTRLVLQSLLPINESFGRYSRLTGKTDQIPQINERLQQLAQQRGIPYVNLFPLFCENGTTVLRSELTTDGLHLNKKGYDIWCKALNSISLQAK